MEAPPWRWDYLLFYIKKAELLALALPICFEEIRHELIETGRATKKIGELLLWAFGLNLLFVGVLYSLFDGVMNLESLL